MVSKFLLPLNNKFFLEFQAEIQVPELQSFHDLVYFCLNFSMNDLASAYPAIPVDLFGKKHHGLGHRELTFTDSSGKIAFRAKRQSPRSSSDPHHQKRILLLDTTGNPLFSICLDHVSPSFPHAPHTANELL